MINFNFFLESSWTRNTLSSKVVLRFWWFAFLAFCVYDRLRLWPFAFWAFCVSRSLPLKSLSSNLTRFWARKPVSEPVFWRQVAEGRLLVWYFSGLITLSWFPVWQLARKKGCLLTCIDFEVRLRKLLSFKTGWRGQILVFTLINAIKKIAYRHVI